MIHDIWSWYGIGHVTWHNMSNITDHTSTDRSRLGQIVLYDDMMWWCINKIHVAFYLCPIDFPSIGFWFPKRPFWDPSAQTNCGHFWRRRFYRLSFAQKRDSIFLLPPARQIVSFEYTRESVGDCWPSMIASLGCQTRPRSSLQKEELP